MKRRQPQAANAARRRTTLTLPADSLAQAERIAQARKVNLSVVVSEALSDGLRMHTAAERSEQVLNAYKKAFIRFSDEEMMLLDGVLLEPAPKRRR
jgi:post-segregation antitoxin (ccd killing protein)